MLRGIRQRKALTVVYGGPGRGKTTLAQNLLRDLVDGDYALRFLSIPHEGCASGWFLPNVARQYGIRELAPTIPQLIDQVHARLIEVKQAGKYPVLFVDEAQLFRNASAMEEFRGLLNLIHDGEKLVSMVLFGLYELGEIIKLDPPLAQRVDIRVELESMDRDESAKYLEHRIKSAGGSMKIFTSDAIDAMYAYSGGVPRLLNTLADNTLFDGLLSEANPTDGSLVASAAESLGLSAADASETPSGLELEPDTNEAALDAASGETVAIQPLGESTSGAADWLEPPAPMPDSIPAARPPAPVKPASPPVDAALLE
ncbi:MAG: AAA family ATPase [Hyphomicrobium sp.]